VAAVEDALDLAPAITLLAVEDEVSGECQVIEDGVSLRELAEQIVALEKCVVTVGGMSHHQHLQRQRVGFHQVHQRGAGVDHDFVRQPAHPFLVRMLLTEQLLAKTPVCVMHRHADRRAQVDHLRRGDHLVLDWIGVEVHAPRVLRKGGIEAPQHRDSPLRAPGDWRVHALLPRDRHRYRRARHQLRPRPLGFAACALPRRRSRVGPIPGIRRSASSRPRPSSRTDRRAHATASLRANSSRNTGQISRRSCTLRIANPPSAIAP
jgi:hypothetical protein